MRSRSRYASRHQEATHTKAVPVSIQRPGLERMTAWEHQPPSHHWHHSPTEIPWRVQPHPLPRPQLLPWTSKRQHLVRPQTTAGKVMERAVESPSLPSGRRGKQTLIRREYRRGRTRLRIVARRPRLEKHRTRFLATASRSLGQGRSILLRTPQVEMRSPRTRLLWRQPWASVQTDGWSQAPGKPLCYSRALRSGAATAATTAAAPTPWRRPVTRRRRAPRLLTRRAATRGHAHLLGPRSPQGKAWRPRSTAEDLPSSTTVTARTQGAWMGARLGPRLLAPPKEQNLELPHTTIRLRVVPFRRGLPHKRWPGALAPVPRRALHFVQGCLIVPTCWSPSSKLMHAGATPGPDLSQGWTHPKGKLAQAMGRHRSSTRRPCCRLSAAAAWRLLPAHTPHATLSPLASPMDPQGRTQVKYTRTATARPR